MSKQAHGSCIWDVSEARTVYFHYFLLTFKLFQVTGSFLPALYSFLWLTWQENGAVVFWLHMCCPSIFPLARVSLPFFLSNWQESNSNKGNTESGGSVSWKPLRAGKGDSTGDCLPLAASCGMPHHRLVSTLLHNAGACTEVPLLDKSHQSQTLSTPFSLAWKEAPEPAVAALRILMCISPQQQDQGEIEAQLSERRNSTPALAFTYQVILHN